MKLNHQHTKLIRIDHTKKVDGAPNIHDVEIVEKIIYLGTHISKGGTSSIDIKIKIGLVKTAMTRLNKIWKDKQITSTT